MFNIFRFKASSKLLAIMPIAAVALKSHTYCDPTNNNENIKVFL